MQQSAERRVLRFEQFRFILGGIIVMRDLRLFLLLLATVACVKVSAGQAATSTPAKPAAQAQQATPRTEVENEGEERAHAAAPATASLVAPNEAVITIKGFCESSQSVAANSKPDCKTVITRAEFEKLADTLQPNMPPQVRKQLAGQYPQILYMSQEARKRGLEKDPHFLELLNFTKMQLLKLELERSLADEAGKVSDTEIAEFYDKNATSFQEASLQRIFIPKARQSDAPKEGASPAEMEAARQRSTSFMSKLADDLRSRAAAGEDFDKLQKEAYEAAGVKGSPPPTSIPKVRRTGLPPSQAAGVIGSPPPTSLPIVRRTGLPPSQAAVLEFKEGEVSQVMNDPQGFFIYRLVSKSTPPLADVKEEIHATLRGQRLDAIQSKMQDAVTADLNKDYFGADAPAGAPAQRGGPKPNPRPRPTPPPSQPQQ
jgi:hypothetical protein